MLFNSHAFILLFLPVTLGGFWVLKRLGVGVSIVWLSILSTLFYVWWNPLYLPLLLSSIAFNFFMGRLVGKTQSKLLAGLAISANIGLLLYYKYLHFFTSLIPSDLGVPVIPELVLPLAISFFTFTQIGYIVEVLRGKLLGHSFKEYYFFVAFFPHLIAGPIVQAGVLLPQLRSGCFKADSRMFAAGLTLFVMGLFKKVLIADPIAAYANPIFYAAEAGQALTIIEAWTGALAYSLQLYYDFSGYSDMAIGLGAMFGIRFPMNFNSPYQSRNIIEFWRRWHMSLSAFLKQYLYIPLGGNRKGPQRRYVNMMITMVIGGMWHGAGTTFLVWGFWHGLLLCLNHGWQAISSHLGLKEPGRIGRASSWLLTLVAVMIGWVFFRADSMDSAFRILSVMGGGNGIVLADSYQRYLGPLASALQGWGVTFQARESFVFLAGAPQLAFMGAALAVAALAPNSQSIVGFRHDFCAFADDRPSPSFSWRPNLAYATGVATILIWTVLSLSEKSEFIYFNF